jgi:hypothetical protein
MWSRFGRVVTLGVGTDVSLLSRLSQLHPCLHINPTLTLPIGFHRVSGQDFIIKHALTCDRVTNVLFCFLTPYTNYWLCLVSSLTATPYFLPVAGGGWANSYSIMCCMVFMLQPESSSEGIRLLRVLGRLPQLPLPFKSTTTTTLPFNF